MTKYFTNIFPVRETAAIWHWKWTVQATNEFGARSTVAQGKAADESEARTKADRARIALSGLCG